MTKDTTQEKHPNGRDVWDKKWGWGLAVGSLHSLCRCTYLPALPLFKCVDQPRGSENLYIKQLLYLLPGSLPILGRSSVELKALLFVFGFFWPRSVLGIEAGPGKCQALTTGPPGNSQAESVNFFSLIFSVTSPTLWLSRIPTLNHLLSINSYVMTGAGYENQKLFLTLPKF